MRRAEAGRLDEARALWRQVIDTQMMAFFEFDMASYYLRHGPATEPIVKPRAPSAKAAPIPDGSI